MMKETVITPGRKRRELRVFIACVLAAYILNVVGIIIYSSPIKELITQIPLVLLVALVFYVFTGMIRILLNYISRLWSK